MAAIPITVFTGFLGAGKTSLILSLLPQLPLDYRVVLLKNEFGDVEVDSKLAQASSLAAVSEILNGCMCCVLVGQMQNALLEIRDKYRPDRIFIECEGSAFPATLAFQIRDLERETHGDFKLDAIVTVVDAENFTGYEDTSPTAKMQASYSDIIVINKWEHVTERQLDIVYDHLNTLNDETPKIRCKDGNKVDPELLFGIDTRLFKEEGTAKRAIAATDKHAHNDEVQTVTKTTDGVATAEPVAQDMLESALDRLPKESVWRVKGFVDIAGKGAHILNWAFGRFELTKASGVLGKGETVKLTMMGERGEVKRFAKRFAAGLRLEFE
ncbi:cobW-domain-containing protein [Fistulina hepatica ATCC 64428]|uniref:CobW-domain-containing protein n=1 Tax=Fistulina hepatica ATCC 64428 TaxID=1128425 RepID=A0A0D7AMN8_9AGAR|nr:cobW-domain-containing protein [Fistulina hepatica ATCC 64428]